jgi:hypothetical protein
MDEQSKLKHSKRIHQKEVVVARKTKIAKAHGIVVKNPHELLDHSPVSCGNPKCVMCANTRKTFNELTIQEKRHLQELESLRDKRSNGMPVDQI